MRGDLWIKNPSKEQLDDREREARLFKEAEKVLVESKELQEDFYEHHLGEVDIADDTPQQTASREYQEDFIDKMNGRGELFENYKSFTAEVRVCVCVCVCVCVYLISYTLTLTPYLLNTLNYYTTIRYCD